MDWINRLNSAINYIEENLSGNISLEEAAKIVCCSPFNFQRMFSYIAGIPLSEYIRRRKMTTAAFDLQSTNQKIVDISVKYGYDSPTAFNRAFKAMHGITPSAAREEGAVLKAYPPIKISISIKGEAEMNYKIEKKDAFNIIGIKETMKVDIEENFNAVPLFWQKAGQAGIIPKLCSFMSPDFPGILGVSTCMNGEEFDYYIAVASNAKSPDLNSYTVPSATWAIFECEGALPHALQNLQRRIVTEWLPTSGYEYADAPDIEVYSDGDQSSPNYKCQVWVPIKK